MAPSSNDGRWYWLAVALLMLLMGLYLTIGGGILLGKGRQAVLCADGVGDAGVGHTAAGAAQGWRPSLCAGLCAEHGLGLVGCGLGVLATGVAPDGVCRAGPAGGPGYAQLEAGKLVMNDYGRLGAAVSVVVLGLGIVATAVSAFSPKGVIAPRSPKCLR